LKFKVLIAGAGQLGSRYLQGLAKVTDPLSIWVLDPLDESLIRARDRWNEVKPLAGHEVHYVSNLSLLPKSLDLAIVASTADVRAFLVGEIGRYSFVCNWVLEKVLAQNLLEIGQLKTLLKGSKSSWVNTPMHLWPLYQKIHALYSSKIPIEANFEGFRGLACNSIHFIDFVARWNGAEVTKVDTSGLQQKWYTSKREGFFEIDGQILVFFTDGSKLRVASDHKNLGYNARLKIGLDEWEIFDSEGTARCKDGRTLHGSIVFQSELTSHLVENIFVGLPCGLPTFEESAQQHTYLIKALLDHWNLYMPNKVERLPIT
jgi:hypothetical protein